MLDISYRTDRLHRECTEEKLMRRVHGVERTRKLKVRLAQLEALDCLSDIGAPMTGAARCHELQGDLKDHFSVDLDHPYRLIFRPTDDPPARKVDGGWDWTRIRSIEIVSILDTH